LVRVRVGSFETIVVCTPELVRQVLLNDRIFDKVGPFLTVPETHSVMAWRRVRTACIGASGA
jgi:hypothetical protein